MTTLDNRPSTALLVIDVQNGVVGEAHDRDRGVTNVSTLVAKARAAGVGVVWVAHHSDEMPRDSEGWRYMADRGGDSANHKNHVHITVFAAGFDPR